MARLVRILRILAHPEHLRPLQRLLVGVERVNRCVADPRCDDLTMSDAKWPDLGKPSGVSSALLSGEEVGRELVNARGAELNHHVRQFIGRAGDHLLHALLTGSGKRPESRPADEDRSGSHRDRRCDVLPGPVPLSA